MSQIKPSYLIISLVMTFSLVGCGDKNDKAVFSSDTGHPSGWSTAHKTSAKADLETCVDCHGSNLEGGIAHVSCTTCHLSTLDSISKHPLMWGSYGYARHKSFVVVNGTQTCANSACHGAALTGVSGSGPACATTCHLGGPAAKHPAVWSQYSSHGNYAKAHGATSCSITACHGTDSKGVFLSGPSCYTCHPAGPAGNHPAEFINSAGHFGHKSYILTNGVASCWTAMCHGTRGVGTVGAGPSCSTRGCHI